MKQLKILSLCFLLGVLTACSSSGKSYENQVFPKGKWQAVNTQNQAGAFQ